MKKIARSASVLFCLTFCVAAGHTAAAAERGFYVGGHFGQSSKDAPRSFYELFNDDIQVFSLLRADTASSISFDDSDTAFGLIGGYRLTPHLAFEGGYVNLGQVTYTSRSSGNFPLESGDRDRDHRERDDRFHRRGARRAAVVAQLGAVHARRGAVRDQQDQDRGQCAGPRSSFRRWATASPVPIPQSTTNIYAGLGISRRFFEIYDLRLEYQRTFDVGDEATGGKGDLDAALLGLVVTF